MTARCEACECGAPLPEFISVVNVTRHLANCPIHLTARIVDLEAKLAEDDWYSIAEDRTAVLNDMQARAEAAEKAYFQACRERETERVLKEQAVELLRNRYGDYQLWG